jgi:hypothetical protein
MTTPGLRRPAECTEDYPGFTVDDGRVTGSINIGPTRLSLWAVTPYAFHYAAAELSEAWPHRDPADWGDAGTFLANLLNVRGDFARLMCVLAAQRLAIEDMELSALAGAVPRALVEFNPRSRQRNNAWDDRPDKLWLLTPEEFALVPDGTTLVCINGKTKIKGEGYIDQDTRAGYIAWGLLDSQLPPAPAEGAR